MDAVVALASGGTLVNAMEEVDAAMDGPAVEAAVPMEEVEQDGFETA